MEVEKFHRQPVALITNATKRLSCLESITSSYLCDSKSTVTCESEMSAAVTAMETESISAVLRFTCTEIALLTGILLWPTSK